MQGQQPDETKEEKGELEVEHWAWVIHGPRKLLPSQCADGPQATEMQNNLVRTC